MKKSIFQYFLLVFLIIFILINIWLFIHPYRSGKYDKSTVVKVLVKNNIKTLEEYIEWLRKNIKYKKDVAPYSWANPEETIERGYGDCEDFAFLTQEILHQLGYKPAVIGMYSIKNGHAICIVKKDNQWTVIDNDTYYNSKISDINKFMKFLKTKYKFFYAWEVKYE